MTESVTSAAGSPLLKQYLSRFDEDISSVKIRGRVKELVGLVIRAAIPHVSVGDVVRIYRAGGDALNAEVVGFKNELAMLMPLGELDGIGPDCEVEATGQRFCVPCGEPLLGRVLDGLGQIIDGGPGLELSEMTLWPVMRPAPSPLSRKPITRALSLGVRAIDGLLTVGEGQRVGLFAGSGVGKSTLMGQIARGSQADIIVICLVGERGREVRDFLETVLGEEGRRRAVVVCATSDMPSLVRLKSAYVATAIAEWFRMRGKSVLFMMDSLTRFARAQREIGLAAGEPPARQGYPPSVFSLLPGLLERTGNDDVGSITALYTVLVEGSDMEEPIADEVRGILDGHVILSRELANQNHWPAIDVLPSLSRVMNLVTTPGHQDAANCCREILATYASRRELIRLGAYSYGSDERVDLAIDLIEEVNAFLKQRTDEHTTLDDTIEHLIELME